jgi:ATP-dependent Lon protease
MAKGQDDTDVIELTQEMEVPVIAVRNTVIFPIMALPINVGRPKSVKAVQKALEGSEILAIITQKEALVEEPGEEDLYEMGTIVKIVKSVKVPGNKYSVIIQGVTRVRVLEWMDDSDVRSARVALVESDYSNVDDKQELLASLRTLASSFIDLSPSIGTDTDFLFRSLDDVGDLADALIHHLSFDVEEKQQMLELLDVHARVERTMEQIKRENHVLELSRKIQSEVKGEMDKAQRDYYLREQLKAIQRELGESDDRGDDFEDLRTGIRDAKMPEDVEKVAMKELKRMSRMNSGAAEYTVSRTYIDWLIELPWSKTTSDRLDVDEAEKILNEDHYGLDKVKQRILEYLSVLKLKADMKGPILCLVGPPGVGKTSLAKSVARALGREMNRIALGGVHDEAEIRGHRRTYIGSMPGSIIKSIKKAGTKNPVFVLDEIDKLSSDHRGDPSSALLEVLDPEQNDHFMDHYLDVPFDLSKVLFIATANIPDTIPGPLRDRMEIIRISGYTHREKVQIARKYLIPEVRESHGLKAEDIEIHDAALDHLIEDYTREAGVRGLKREIAALCRWVARQVASGDNEKGVVDLVRMEEIRGPAHFFKDMAERTSVPGVATGLAWTPTGGQILFIEAAKMKGKGGLTLTGSLGDVMKESVSVARSYIRSVAQDLGIPEPEFEDFDIHIHVPSGAIPKDGPSAGVTMVTALTSLFTGICVRPETAMSGEITLRGTVLPVGGIKEKVLAAHRAGIKTLVLPEKNRKDLLEVPDEVKNELTFHFARRLDDVLDITIGRENIERFIAQNQKA